MLFIDDEMILFKINTIGRKKQKTLYFVYIILIKIIVYIYLYIYY